MSAEIIERLKKLLRLARSSNPNEAALAMQKAMELAAEHRIALDQVNPDHEAPRFTHCDADDHFARLPHEHQFAALICKRFFRVRTIQRSVCRNGRDGWPQRRETVAFVGTESDVEIAIYVFGFLVHHFRFCWRKHRGRCRNRYAFLHGMYQGLCAKLLEAELAASEREAKGDEIELSMNAYLAKHFGELKSSPLTQPTASAARWAGYVQGRKTEIRGGIKPGEAAPLALS